MFRSLTMLPVLVLKMLMSHDDAPSAPAQSYLEQPTEMTASAYYSSNSDIETVSVPEPTPTQARAPMPPAAPAPEPQTLWYTVSPGDSLYLIASSFGVELDALVSVNGIQNPKLLQIGQKLRIPKLDALPEGVDNTVTKVLSATLTAYTAGYESTGKTASDPAYGITYSGTKVQEGRTVAVDPSIIPLGSTLFIEGVGLRKAEDTGGAIRGKKIDVFIADLEQARSFGVKKNVNVYVLKSGNSL